MGRLSRFVSKPGDFVPGDTYLKPVTVPELLRRLGVPEDASADERDAAVTEWLGANERCLHQGLEISLELSGYRRRQARRSQRPVTSSSR